MEVEIYKCFEGTHFDDELFPQSREWLLADGDEVYPDLIIHEDRFNPINQVLALECNMNPRLRYVAFCNDLFKPMIYKEILAFKLKVFVVANVASKANEDYFNRNGDSYYLNVDNLYI